ncbi:15866_t:CDS:2, partial [Gigaspora rosea]
MSLFEFSKLPQSFLKILQIIKSRIRHADAFGKDLNLAISSKDQINALFSTQKNKSKTRYKVSCSTINIAISNKLSKKIKEKTIKKMVHRLLRDKLNIWDIRAEAYALALLAKNTNTKKAEANCIDYPNEFILESIKKRLDSYNTSTLPNLQALTNITIILCICPAKLKTLHITNTGVTGAIYAIVVHGAKNLAYAITIAKEALYHNPDNNTSLVQNYIV